MFSKTQMQFQLKYHQDSFGKGKVDSICHIENFFKRKGHSENLWEIMAMRGNFYRR